MKQFVIAFVLLALVLEAKPNARATSVPGALLSPEATLGMERIGAAYDGGVPSEVRLAPDGSAVVYTARKTLLSKNEYVYDLYLVKTNGNAEPRQLTHNAPLPANADRAVFSPRWAPDSKSIAFLGNVGGQRQVLRLNLASGQVDQLTDDRSMSSGTVRASGEAYGLIGRRTERRSPTPPS